MPDYETRARAFLEAHGALCKPKGWCVSAPAWCGCPKRLAALAALLAEVAGKAEGERAEQWRMRRDAESSRDVSKAVAATCRDESDRLEAALREIAAMRAGELSLGDRVRVVTLARETIRDLDAERNRLNVR